MQGRCYYCNKGLTERTIKRHMKNCLEMGKVIEENMKGAKGKAVRDQFVISIKDKYASSVYCIYVSIDSNLQLQHLDKFIRDIWVECCGHLSAFYIDGESYNDNSDGQYEMNYYLKDVLSLNKKFEYQYDFGSTTELILEVIDIIKVPKEFTQIEIIARNNEEKSKCHKCGDKATYFNWNTEEWLCKNCAQGIDEDELEEVSYSNSPRDGVCGYVGDKDAETLYLPQNNKKYKIDKKKPVYNDDFEFASSNLDDDWNISNFLQRMSEEDNKEEVMEEILEDEFFKHFSKAYSKVASSYLDRFYNGKYSFDLRELIEAYPKKQISTLADNIGLKLASNLKKADMIEKYVNEYENLIKNKMNILDYDIYKMLHKCVRTGGIMHITNDLPERFIDMHEFLMYEGIIFPCMKDEEPVFIMPEIMQKIVKQSDTIAFRKLMKRNSEILNLFIGMLKAYGCIYFEDAKILIEKYNIDFEETALFLLLEQGSFYYNSEYYCVEDDDGKVLFVNEEIEDYEEILNKIDDSLDYVMIDKEKLISMSKEDYLEKSSLGKRFIREFSSMFEMDKDDIADNMEILALDMQYRESREILKDVLTGIEENIDKEDEQMVCNLINKLIRNIPIWKYKGATLNEKEGSDKPIINKKNIGRNEPCPCNSGKKYKNCCGRNGNTDL